MRAGEYGAQPETAALGGSIAIVGGAAQDRDPADAVLSAHAAEAQVLRRMGIGKPWIARMVERAVRHGTTIEQELLFGGGMREDAYYAGMARLVGLPYLDSIAADRVIDRAGIDTQLQCPILIQVANAQKMPVTVIAPEALRVPQLLDSLERMPELRQQMAIAAPSRIRGAVWQAGATKRAQATVQALFETSPNLSARIVLAGRQGFFLGIAVSLFVALLALSPSDAFLSFHVCLSLLYFSALLFRIAALNHQRRHGPPPLPPTPDGPPPVYTVMVALYREAPVAEQLIRALSRLDWPASKLDIKLVCEADDAPTIAALKAAEPAAHFEIVEVPPMPPRTKPKALSYALSGARGAFVAIYDAEDRPHPLQLREAYAKFASSPPAVACLQAPLVIANGRDSWISALFALEYSALFRRLLPALANYSMPLPLGGTSNHFRTEVLRAVGGWDPFNVTEDADLGMRLHRCGYRSDVIDRPTLEDAPTGLKVWLGQRTRWFKGWLQTWLVMMREPMVTRREMGLRAFLAFQLMVGGMLVSSLTHPAIFVMFAISAAAMLENPADNVTLLQCLLLAIDLANIFGSYIVFLVLGASAMIDHELRQVGKKWLFIPAYWIMVSYAAWRAVFELRSNPFFWQKTPHNRSVVVRKDEGTGEKSG